MSDVLASREHEVATPTTIHEWIDSGSHELSVDLLEGIAKQLDVEFPPTEIWPGSPKLLIRLMQSDYFHKLDGLTYRNLKTGIMEPVGRHVLAHSVRSALVAWEIASLANTLLGPVHPQVRGNPTERPTPTEVFDCTYLHDIGKSQIGLYKPYLLSQNTIFKPGHKMLMYGHAELGEAMLKDLNGFRSEDKFVMPEMVSKIARDHHTLHPREFTLDNNKQSISPSDQIDDAYIYALILCAIADSAEATYSRPYMQDTSKQHFRFPATGNSLDIERWASRMIIFPQDISAQTHEDFGEILAIFSYLVNQKGTITNKIFRPAA